MAFQIRKEQLDVFEEVRQPGFKVYMVEHLNDFTPLHCEALGENGICRIIQFGTDRAKEYGFTNQAPVRFYIEMLFMLGCNFDTDPQFPWAKDILGDPHTTDQRVRADRLYNAAMQYRDSVGGLNGERALEALRRVKEAHFEPLPASSDIFEGEVFRHMKEIHIEKWEYVGEAPLRQLIQKGKELAQKYAVTSDKGVAILIGLMYALGHGVITDLKYPWIEQTLTNAVTADPNKRVERVYSKAMTYLDHVLTHLGKD